MTIKQILSIVAMLWLLAIIAVMTECCSSDAEVYRPLCGRIECCKVCIEGKPCGDTCIAINKSCGKSVGCACTKQEAQPCSEYQGFER